MATSTKPRPAAASSILWLLAERSLKAVGGVAIGVAIARQLGPDNYGRYGAAIGLATLAKEVVALGIDRLVRRDLAKEPERTDEIMGTSMGLAMTAAVLIGLVLTFFAQHGIQDPLTRKMAMIVVWMSVPQALYSAELWFEARCETRPLVWTRNVVWLISITARIVLVLREAPVHWFAICAVSEWVLTYAAVWALFWRVHGWPKLHFAASRVRGWMREGWPALAMIGIGATADRLMVLLVQTLATSQQAGYLNAAIRISEIWWSFSAIIASVLLPRLVTVRRDHPSRFPSVMRDYVDVSFLFGLAGAVGVSIAAPLIIPRLFGAAYVPSVPVLVILFWAGPAIYPGVTRTQRFVLDGKLLLDLPIVSSIAGSTILLSILLVPRFGAIGAATSMALGQWIGIYGAASAIPALRRESKDLYNAFGAPLRLVSVIQRVRNFVSGGNSGAAEQVAAKVPVAPAPSV